MDIHIDAQTIITAAALLTALGSMIALFIKIHNWFLEQKKQSVKIEALEKKHNEDMKAEKEETQLICYALAACLDGLQQLGCNHTVTDAKNKMDKHLNEKAHAYKEETL
jgi:hypothetical protein